MSRLCCVFLLVPLQMEFRNLVKQKRNFQYLNEQNSSDASTSSTSNGSEELTKEQREIIERNRQAALEKRKKLEMNRQIPQVTPVHLF